MGRVVDIFTSSQLIVHKISSADITMQPKQQISKFVFRTSNPLSVQEFLEEHADLDPREVLDGKKSNILHNLAFNDQKDLLKIYINHTARLIQRAIDGSGQVYKKDATQEIASWLNQKNQEGFTPLLYASFNGHVELIHYLIEKGSNFNLFNNTRLNVLHMAAQNNKVSSFIYFRGKMDFNVPDEKGSTPLHWAAYSGSEEVVAYLVTLPDVKIDQRDNEGQTALLIATLYGNTKIVRRLLIKGADRYIKNKKGELPIQIAREQQFKNITKMLDEDYSCFDFLKFYYNVKIDYTPQNRSFCIPFVFIVTCLCSLLIQNGLLAFEKLELYAFEGAVVGIMLLLYASLLQAPKVSEKENISLYINETKKLCFECAKKKPKRSYHCDICKVCIEQYDHHCTWINNCVGKRNIARFVTFIFFLLISLGIIGTTSTYGLIELLFGIQMPKGLMKLRELTQTEFQKWAKALLFSLNILVSLFALPVLLLFLVQIKNLLINKTTYERIRGDNSSVRDQLKQKRKRGASLANCKAMCSQTKASFSSDQSLDDELLSK